MRIRRDSYLQKLIDRKGNGLVKVVTGIRRCGKSYLLFKLFREHLLAEGVEPSRIVEVKLDDRANKALRDPDACYEFVRSAAKGKESCFVLLDEVQLMSEFEDVLNGFLHLGNADVYVTGSNSKFLSTDIITEFRGRGDEVRVHPLTFAEFYEAFGGEWATAWNEYYTFGGMPYLLNLHSDEEKISYLERLFEETYLRDIVDRNRIKGSHELEELVDVLASSVGSLTNPRKIAATFTSSGRKGVSETTIKRYLSALEDAFMVSCAARYDVRGRKAIGSPFKYYFEDVGLRNARLKFRQQEQTHIMENVVYNELIARGYAVDVGVVEVRQMRSGVRETTRTEIDFVANLGSRRYYVQSAFALGSESKREQEVRSLNGTGDSFKKIIVTRDDGRLSRDENGIVTMSLRDFLLNPQSLDL